MSFITKIYHGINDEEFNTDDSMKNYEFEEEDSDESNSALKKRTRHKKCRQNKIASTNQKIILKGDGKTENLVLEYYKKLNQKS